MTAIFGRDFRQENVVFHLSLTLGEARPNTLANKEKKVCDSSN
jgi:hypothetical protein